MDCFARAAAKAREHARSAIHRCSAIQARERFVVHTMNDRNRGSGVGSMWSTFDTCIGAHAWRECMPPNDKVSERY